MFLGPPNRLSLRALEELVKVLHWRVGGLHWGHLRAVGILKMVEKAGSCKLGGVVGPLMKGGMGTPDKPQSWSTS